MSSIEGIKLIVKTNAEEVKCCTMSKDDYLNILTGDFKKTFVSVDVPCDDVDLTYLKWIRVVYIESMTPISD